MISFIIEKKIYGKAPGKKYLGIWHSCGTQSLSSHTQTKIHMSKYIFRFVQCHSDKNSSWTTLFGFCWQMSLQLKRTWKWGQKKLMSKYICQFGQIWFAIWTNIVLKTNNISWFGQMSLKLKKIEEKRNWCQNPCFTLLDKYCLQLGQIHFLIWTNVAEKNLEMATKETDVQEENWKRKIR